MLVARLLIIMTIIALGAAVAEADIYRYVDDNGVVCYTDAPLNKKAERIMKTDTAGIQERSAGTSESGDFDGIVVNKAAKYKIDPSLVHAVIKTESNGDPYAVSRKGAMGLMQLMPGTADDLEVRNPFDPEENIEGGTRYLRYLIEKFGGDLTLALAAYNAGPTLVEKRGSVPEISETKRYVKKVLSLYKGKTYLSVPSSNQALGSKPEVIYRIISRDGSVLFTNSPQYNKNSRL
jgi:soluble lytic murein transglycosylase-like protein